MVFSKVTVVGLLPSCSDEEIISGIVTKNCVEKKIMSLMFVFKRLRVRAGES